MSVVNRLSLSTFGNRLKTFMFDTITSYRVVLSQRYRATLYVIEIRIEGCSRSLEIVLMSRADTSSCWSSILTLSLSCTVYEI